MKKYGKFAAVAAVIIGTLIWLASAGIKDSQTYYKTIAELNQMGDRAYDTRLRVAGDVGAGSITRSGSLVQFNLVQEHRTLKIAYDGSEPLPDTFRDGAQALADGRMGHDGVFHASRIQAKCASKYEAKPGGKTKPSAPINNT